MDNTFAAAKGSIFAHITPGMSSNLYRMFDAADSACAILIAVRDGRKGRLTISEPDLFAIANTVRGSEPLTSQMWSAMLGVAKVAGYDVPDTYGKGTVSAKVFAALAKR